MSTATRSGAAAGGQLATGSAPPDDRHRPDRVAAWRASWRVALRMARRDVRRHRGRSIVALVMVGLPTLIVCAALTLEATSRVAGEEVIPLALGSAEAELQAPIGSQILQGPVPDSGYTSDGRPARAIPGYDDSATPFDNAAAISGLTGGEAIPWAAEQVRARTGDRSRDVTSLAISDPSGAGERVELVSGRWPRGADEVLISPRAAETGLPSTGEIELAGGGAEDPRTVAVVGTADARDAYGTRYDLISTQPMTDSILSNGWLLQRDRPVTWPEVRRLNAHGMPVLSADVVRHPPPDDQLDPQLTGSEQAEQTALVVGVGGSLLAVVIALLVSPAFAVGAARQRRTLALAAANGATAGQLRRAVLGQAVVLGVLSAVLGSVVGIVAGVVAARMLDARGLVSSGPIDVPWWSVAVVLIVAVLSAVLAALVPTVRIGRLDIVGVMRGRQSADAPSRLLLVAGLVLFALGAVAVLHGARRTGTEVQVGVGTVLVVIGALLVVPTLLHLLGRLGGRLPLPLRLATRDLSRHRTRSAPTIAAVLAGSAALTAGLIGVSSDTEQARREYQPMTVLGEAVVDGTRPTISSAAIRRYEEGLPDLVLEPSWSAIRQGASTTTFVSLVPPGCTAAQSVRGVRGRDCRVVGTYATDGRGVTVLRAEEIVRRLGLEGADARTVRDGGVVVLADRADGSSSGTSGGRAVLGHGTVEGNAWAKGAVRADPTLDVPAVVVDTDDATRAAALHGRMLVPREVVQRAGWSLPPGPVLAHTRDGSPMTDVQEERLLDLVGTEGYVAVERGFQDPLLVVTLVLVGLFSALLLVVTLTSAGLSLAEQAGDQATLAAVGAGRGTRRLMAGSQALVLAGVGALLGVAVGLVPGIAVTYPLTAVTWDQVTGEEVLQDPTLVIPWVALLTMCLVVPLVAGALAALAVRRAPDATRRTR